MFTALIIFALCIGGAGYFVKQRYDAVLAKVKQVEDLRKKVNQLLNERHKSIKSILTHAKEQGWKDPSLTQLNQLRKKMKEAHESHDEDEMVQAEVLITENSANLTAFLGTQGFDAAVIDAYNKADQSLAQIIAKYHTGIEQYDEQVEQFAESVLIAVFEKDLFRKFPFFEQSDEDDGGVPDDNFA